MKSPAVLAAAIVVGVLTSSGAPAGHPSHQAAIVTFQRPTWVAHTLLIGTYVVVHDDTQMARGEPCTMFYRVGSRPLPLEQVVSFMCIPRARPVVSQFTTTVDRTRTLDMDILTEYQFAGDAEGHGVPALTLVAYEPGQAPACLRQRAP